MACVTYMDESIGRILDLLDELKIADNTIVIFFSDNGAGGRGDNSPLRGGKSRMFEGGLRVPCIIRWPGKVPPATVSSEFLTSMEIFPTLCQAAGAKPPKDVILDGFDMTEVLTGRKKSPRNAMFWQRRGDKAARVGKYKWVQSQKGSGLFDLEKDISEQNDLSTKHPEILNRLKQNFATWKQNMQAAEPRRPFKDF